MGEDLQILTLVIIYYAVRLYKNFGRGAHWNQLLYASPDIGKERQVSPVLCLMRGLVGLTGIGFAVFFIAEIIQASVWTGSRNFLGWIFAYICFNYSLLLLMGGIRDYQKFVHGAPNRILSSGQNELLCQAIFDGESGSGAKLYRRIFPDVSEQEATDFVTRLAGELKKKQPEKFVPPARFWELNWRAMKICLTIGIGVMACCWLLLPSSSEARWPMKLGGVIFGFLAGASCFVPLRLKGFWKRLCFVVLLFFTTMVASLRFFSEVAFIYYEGFALGACMFIAGCQRKRRKYTL